MFLYFKSRIHLYDELNIKMLCYKQTLVGLLKMFFSGVLPVVYFEWLSAGIVIASQQALYETLLHQQQYLRATFFWKP